MLCTGRRRWISFFLLVPISSTIHFVIKAWSPSRLTFSILSFCSWANFCILDKYTSNRRLCCFQASGSNFNNKSKFSILIVWYWSSRWALWRASFQAAHRSFYWSVAVPTHIWTYQVKLEAYQLSHAHTLCQSLDTPENWKWEEEILKKSAGFLELRLGWKGLQWRRRWGRLLVFHRLQFDAKLRRGWRGMAGYDGGWRYFASFLPQSYLGQE